VFVLDRLCLIDRGQEIHTKNVPIIKSSTGDEQVLLGLNFEENKNSEAPLPQEQISVSEVSQTDVTQSPPVSSPHYKLHRLQQQAQKSINRREFLSTPQKKIDDVLARVAGTPQKEGDTFSDQKLRNEFIELQEQFARLQKDFINLQQQHNEAKRNIETLNLEKSALSESTERIKSDFKKQFEENIQIPTLRNQIAELETKFNKLRREGGASSSLLNEVEEERDKLRVLVKNLTLERDELEENVRP